MIVNLAVQEKVKLLFATASHQRDATCLLVSSNGPWSARHEVGRGLLSGAAEHDLPELEVPDPKAAAEASR